jgi:hypothetical protein
MYNSKLVASLKANGKILREFKDTVYIPFGSEYSILIKNLNTVRAIVNVYIDGENAVPGGLVLYAGQEIDLQRAIRNGNLSEGNKFKFVERTGKIEDHRGVKLEDGIVRIEYQFEKVYQRQDGIQWNQTLLGGQHQSGTPTWTVNNSVLRSSGHTHIADASYVATSMSVGSTTASSTIQTMNVSTPINDTGITVPGSKSEQKFSTATWFATETEKYNIILKLLGETPDNKEVRNPVTTKHKPKCVTCGKQNKATAKFCTECGTALEIFA